MGAEKEQHAATIMDDEKHISSQDGEHLDGHSASTANNVSENGTLQDGVKAIEAISQAWTKSALVIAYFSIFLMAFVTSLEGQVINSVVVFVTSSFGNHSMVSTINVVQGVIMAVVKPPMAKVADVFGRTEAFTVSIALYTLGYIVMASSQSVSHYAAAQIFYSAGSTGLMILQQVFIADTTDLSWRALMSTLPDLPFLVTTWIGSIIGGGIMESSGSWRWAYGMWAIILPVSFLPLFYSLFMNTRRAKQMSIAPERKTFQGTAPQIIANLWRDLDMGGIILLSASFSLILIPCTIAATLAGGWQNRDVIAMVTIGAILLVIYPCWEMSTRLGRKYGVKGTLAKILEYTAPYPLTPLHLLKSRTFAAGCILITFYFIAFYLSVFPYFYSYLMVVRNLEMQSAAYITQIFSFSSTVSSIIISVIIKLTKRYKWFIVIGSSLYMLGLGLMMKYRTETSSLSAIIGCQILIGFGGGMLNVPAQLGVQASAGHQNVATATAMFLTVISIGSAIGSAISGAIWGKNVPAKLNEYLPEAARVNATLIYGDVTVALSYPVGTPERIAIARSYQETMTTLLTIAVCMCAPIFLCSLIMADYKLDEMEQGVKGLVIGGQIGEDGKKEEIKKENPYNPVTWFKRS